MVVELSLKTNEFECGCTAARTQRYLNHNLARTKLEISPSSHHVSNNLDRETYSESC